MTPPPAHQHREGRRWVDLARPLPSALAVATGGHQLLLASPHDPRRMQRRLLGRANAGRAVLVYLEVPDGRYHLHVVGQTGAGKSWWLTQYVIGEVLAGRGVALIDPQGDLVRAVLDRLPAWAGDRLVLLDPDERLAPPAYNPLAPGVTAAGGDGAELAREWAAENLAGTMRALYSASWGPRMDGFLRASCLTLARRPDSTVPDIATFLTDDVFRRTVVQRHGTPEGLGNVWAEFDALTPAARAGMTAPLVDRLRAVLSRRFARELLAGTRSTFDLGQILDGGILLARLPKGEIGEETSRLVSGLLLAGLWGETTRRSQQPTDQRLDATILVDEAHNSLNLPIKIDHALAESRGFRVSWVLAHQHLDQLTEQVARALETNARNKIVFTVSPRDARALVRHHGDHFTEEDLCERPGWQISARTVAGGHDQPGYTLDTLPLDPPIPGRAQHLRARARARVGLPHAARAAESGQRGIAATPYGAWLFGSERVS